MIPACSKLVSLLLDEPASVVIVGTGSQAREMRAYLRLRLRLVTEDIPGYSSAEAPIGRRLYVLCATPSDVAFSTLRERGIPESAIISWPALRVGWEASDHQVLNERLRLRCLDDKCRPVFASKTHPQLIEALQLSTSMLCGIGAPEATWSSEQFLLVETWSAAYLALRRGLASLRTERERRLLFPAPGRSGGLSLSNTLTRHPRILLRVDFEGYPLAISPLLTLHRSGRVSEAVVIAFLSRWLDDFDCIGGNPFCFLIPYLSQIPWFEYHVLKVERPHVEIRDSMMLRNFHYSPLDFVSNRITAADWGDMTQAEWTALPLIAKLDWYIPKAYSEIDAGASACARFVRTPIGAIDSALNQVLAGMSWPGVPEVPHTNQIPTDRTYTLEERAKMYGLLTAQP